MVGKLAQTAAFSPYAQFALNPESTEKIVQALKVGMTLQSAAEYAGVHPQSVSRWVDAGYGYLQWLDSGGEPDPAKQKFLDFYQETMQAKQAAKLQMIMTVHKAARNGEWKAAAWFLERTAPEEFARKPVAASVTNHTNVYNVNDPIEVSTRLSDNLHRFLSAKNADSVESFDDVEVVEQ